MTHRSALPAAPPALLVLLWSVCAGCTAHTPITAGPQASASCNVDSAKCGPLGNDDCCASAPLPGGTFLRDNGEAGDASATVSSFRLDRYEVTLGRFRRFVERYPDSRPAPSSGKNANNPDDPGWSADWDEFLPADRPELEAAVQVCDERFRSWGRDDDALPMNCITWYLAQAFCIWDGGRLPTDAESNYASLGGDEQRVFPWSEPPSDSTIDASRAVYQPAAQAPARVGSTSPDGDGKWGQADLSGNVWEWVQDWYLPYPQRCLNCAALSGDSIRVIRGGSFYSEQTNLRASNRLYHAPAQPDFAVGARCARDASAP